METNCTPGPWRIGTPGPNGCYTVGTENGLMVAMVAHSANQLDQCEQAIGDARLIAAAPELLEALCEAEEFISQFEGDDDYTDELTKMLAAIRAAIAKSEGR